MTATLRFTTMPIVAAGVGPDSPLPILRDNDVHTCAPTADPEMAANLAYGQPSSLLPYTPQDGYDRRRSTTRTRVAVLENELLTATFLLGYGGRLWSLTHRPTGRELLFRNPVLQPANLALRDAWFAGGVEWNLGATGHWPLTCSPVHAGRLSTVDGSPVMRLWEYERMRRLVWRVDAWLPPASPVLYVHGRLHNPHRWPVPAYWWSNIAVPQHDQVRVIAPADKAFHVDDDTELHTVPFPHWNGVDRSYPARGPAAADYFFDTHRGERSWIVALDGTGHGLAHASTARLPGRKLFLWGSGAGGKHWQRWLSGTDTGGYLEIQAGLTRTQLEHLPLPPGATWSWTEAYGLAQADPDAVHGAWPVARAAAADAVERLIPAPRLEAAHHQAAASADLPPEVSAHGSAWGAIETRAGGIPPYSGTPFRERSVTARERPWLSLVDTGVLPVSDPPAAPVTGAHWRAWLAGAHDWHALLHLGQLDYADGDKDAARTAWKASHAAHPNAWALRNLAEVARIDGDRSAAADYLLQANALRPELTALTVELLDALIAAGQPARALALIDGLGPADRSHGRVRLLECRAAVAAGDLGRATAILDAGLSVPNLREGEDSLDALWAAYRHASGTDATLPAEYDFRMR
jgi:hypothetical protein